MKTYTKILIIFCFLLIQYSCMKIEKKEIRLKETYVQFDKYEPELYEIEKYDINGNLVEDIKFSKYGGELSSVTKIFYNSSNREDSRFIVYFFNFNYLSKFEDKNFYIIKISKSYNQNNLVREIEYHSPN